MMMSVMTMMIDDAFRPFHFVFLTVFILFVNCERVLLIAHKIVLAIRR